ncbi:Astra associated protein 1 Asa1 [Marasmius crinis-equi]|uniref:ASTRA-associated protein 1 n=1 Tax=Marasmius crinis-equi TaxID=585013 RepID=A0ABR3FR88_9AGAR
MSSFAESAPSPIHLLRIHSTPVSVLHISEDNERIYSGDSSGQVACTSSRTLRVITSWKAHTDGLLGVEELGNEIITHGRDNKLNVWTRTEDGSTSVNLGGPAPIDQPDPTLKYSLDVNALNYCRFSLLPIPGAENTSTSTSSSPTSLPALIALPNLVESSQADVWSLPSQQRLHAGIGNQTARSVFSDGRGGEVSTGIIMSLHLFRTATNDSGTSGHLRLLLAYENGSVALRQYKNVESEVSVEGKGWDLLWDAKLHKESIMAMRVSRDNSLALSVSADHLVGRYDLVAPDDDESRFSAHRTKHPGNGSVAFRDDGRVCAIGGWDGKIRLYSTKKMKPLGTLRYHKQNCNALEFARSRNGIREDEEDEEMSEEELTRRSRWLLGGSSDNRVSIWELMSFEK